MSKLFTSKVQLKKLVMANKTSKLTFKIVTPERVTYSDEVEQVTIPTEAGEITILPNHSPLVSILIPGELRIKKDGQLIHISVSTGFVEVKRFVGQRSELYILADTAERAEEIDIERAKQAKARVEKMLAEQQNMADVDFARLQAVLQRENARLKVVNKYRKIKKL
jgi:F-type H+-transporting ATPase subunit epsilon